LDVINNFENRGSVYGHLSNDKKWTEVGKEIKPMNAYRRSCSMDELMTVPTWMIIEDRRRGSCSKAERQLLDGEVVANESVEAEDVMFQCVPNLSITSSGRSSTDLIRA